MDANETLSLELPASHKYLNVLGACVAAIMERVEGLSDAALLTYNIQTAVQELATNIVAHSYNGANGRIHVRFELENAPRAFVVETRDRGKTFDPLRDSNAEWRVENIGGVTQYILVRAPEVDWSEEHGRGLFLMQSLTDTITFQTVQGENRWRMFKTLTE